MENLYPYENYRSKLSKRLHDWFLLMSSNQEEYCNSHNHQLLLQQHSNNIVSFCFSLIGHLFGRCWITTSRLNKRLQARRDELVQRLEPQRHDGINPLHEALLRRFQSELQQLQDNNLVLNNTWHCTLPRIALSFPASADANKLNEFYKWLGQALKQNTHLRHLILEDMTFSNESTTATSRAILARGLNQSKVESLTIKHNTGYNPFFPFRPNCSNSCYYLFRFLSEILTTSRPSSLTKLTLVGADLSHNNTMALLAKGLSNNTTLTSLVIDLCCVIESGLQVLFSPQGLWNSSTLLHLQLKRCDICGVGVEILVKHWPLDSPLQTLSLPYNGIGHRGAQLLVLDAAHSHPALQTLDLSHNSNIGHGTLQMIGDDLPNQLHLTSLDLSCVTSVNHYLNVWEGIYDESNIEEILVVFRDQARHALVQGIQRNQLIQHLNVLDNAFSRDVEMKIDFYTSCNRLGGRPLFNDFEVPLSCWSFILAYCQHRPSIGPSLLMFCLQEYPNLIPTQSTPL